MTDGPVLQRVRELVEPIAADLDLDLYDVEQRGGTLRVTIDTPARVRWRRRHGSTGAGHTSDLA